MPPQGDFKKKPIASDGLFMFGGLGRNRTTDTRIFNPSHNVKFTSSKLKKRNAFFEFWALPCRLHRTKFRTVTVVSPEVV